MTPKPVEKKDLIELCEEIAYMLGSAIQSSKMSFIDDSTHKEGLVGVMKDVLEKMKKVKEIRMEE